MDCKAQDVLSCSSNGNTDMWGISGSSVALRSKLRSGMKLKLEIMFALIVCFHFSIQQQDIH